MEAVALALRVAEGLGEGVRVVDCVDVKDWVAVFDGEKVDVGT